MDARSSRQLKWLWGLIVIAAIGSLVAREATPVEWLPVEIATAAKLPPRGEMEVTLGAVGTVWAEPPAVTAPAIPPPDSPGNVWVAAHAMDGGGECAFAHACAATFTEAVPVALRSVRRTIAARAARPVSLLLFLGNRVVALDYELVPYSDWRDPVRRGRFGYICYDGRGIHEVLTPFQAHWLGEVTFRRPLEAKAHPPSWHFYTGRQFHVDLAPAGPRITEWLRGKPYVSAISTTRVEVQAMADAAAGWLLRNVSQEGRLPYRVSSGADSLESEAENELRQWMASRALIDAARREGSQVALDTARRHIESNLSRFYREEDGMGVIEFGKQVKLGAVALAALALREFPGAPPEWKQKEERLGHMISFLWRNDGSFRAFLRPDSRRNDNQNFYSGEALLYWATILSKENEPHLMERFKRSLAYYRGWHLKHRNPAFVPWHTMAIVKAWPLTEKEPGAAWVFEMNDWLLAVQQVKGADGHPDSAGRFYAPGRDFGPPHASSTGVYLEGLAAALSLAHRTGDSKRAALYAAAIRAGLRNARQLQFASQADWIHIEEARRPLFTGAFRTTEYDPTIRCDNVQHFVQACWGVLDLPASAGVFAAP